MYLIKEITGAGSLDWEKVEEILEKFPELEDAFIEACREQICYGNCDPVGTIYEIIAEQSELAEKFEIYPNYLATSVSFLGDEEELEDAELDPYTEFLLKEAGVLF